MNSCFEVLGLWRFRYWVRVAHAGARNQSCVLRAHGKLGLYRGYTTVISELYRGYIRVVLGLYRGYIRVILGLYRGYIGVIKV